LPSRKGSLGAAPSLAREVHGMKIFWCGHKSCCFNGECDTQDTPPRDLVTQNLLLSSWSCEHNHVHQLQARCSGDKGVYLYLFLISSSLPIIASWSPKGLLSWWGPLESDTVYIMEASSLLGWCWVGLCCISDRFLFWRHKRGWAIVLLNSLGSILVPGLRRRCPGGHFKSQPCLCA
jgi:hypothetical protein